MKHIKKFNKNIKYYNGDTVICTDNEDQELLKLGKKYIVLKIYTDDNIYKELKYYDSSVENVFVDIVETNSSQTISGIFAHRFITELEFNINKYGL